MVGYSPSSDTGRGVSAAAISAVPTGPDKYNTEVLSVSRFTALATAGLVLPALLYLRVEMKGV